MNNSNQNKVATILKLRDDWKAAAQVEKRLTFAHSQNVSNDEVEAAAKATAAAFDRYMAQLESDVAQDDAARAARGYESPLVRFGS